MKVLCPYHADTNPSMTLYDDGYGFCWVCWKQYRMSGPTEARIKTQKPPEDLDASLDKVSLLPKKMIRGLELPYNDYGYFIIWPDKSYYKVRKYKDDGSKYYGASGHKPPIFDLREGSTSTRTLLVVEGEINALSAKKSMPWLPVISPGSAGHFKVHEDKILEICKLYDDVVIWADEDDAGYECILQLGGSLQFMGKIVDFILSNSDANEILITQGVDKLRSFIRKYTG
jgi:hypothetical protein